MHQESYIHIRNATLSSLQSDTLETSGKIHSLFELNVGFEPGAPDRENIMYRGPLLDETSKGVRKNEQSVIDFADLGESIDYLFNNYSAGMMVCLASVISTSLLLDEILAAGDIAFQKKAKNGCKS
jgi:ABC-type polysaccharide/polyol phosphate transport system ATPase subunit